jgi:hypothetical protein
MESVTKEKHSSLLGEFVSYEESKFLWIRPQILLCQLVFYYICNFNSKVIFLNEKKSSDLLQFWLAVVAQWYTTCLTIPRPTVLALPPPLSPWERKREEKGIYCPVFKASPSSNIHFLKIFCSKKWHSLYELLITFFNSLSARTDAINLSPAAK